MAIPLPARMARRSFAKNAARRPNRWPPASAISPSASFSPRTGTCWASTAPAGRLLTTVKEAVDNALDACEEAGILPEIWVHLQRTGPDRFKVGVQDNGPGILKKTIPLIFGKLLYGSKFHRMRMSRGQQGIGISAAGMYGLLTTGKPVKIMSKISRKDPAHYYEIQIDTKRNLPEILNGKGEGVEVPPGEAGQKAIEKHEIEWIDLDHGTRVTIELEGKHVRGRGSVDEYLEQTAIANPHVSIHYNDPDDNETDYARVADMLPPEPKEILPHPYGVELGRLVAMLKDTKALTLASFLCESFSRVSPGVARKICETAKLSTRARREEHRADRGRFALQGDSGDENSRPGDRLHRADRRGSDHQGPAPDRARRVLYRRHAAAVRLSRQSVSDRSRAGLRRRAGLAQSLARGARRTAGRERRPHAAAVSHHHVQRPGRRRSRQDSRQLGPENPRFAGQFEARRNGETPRGPANDQRQRRAVDEHPPLRQPRAAAIPGRRLRHHANRDANQLAQLRPLAKPRLAARRAGHDHGPHGQRLGAVHQRIERGRRLV